MAGEWQQQEGMTIRETVWSFRHPHDCSNKL